MPLFDRLREGTTESALLDEAAEEGPVAVATAALYLRELDRRGLLLRSAVAGGRRLATLDPSSPWFVFTPGEIGDERLLVVSRFAYTRVDAGRTLIESPLAFARVVVEDESVLALLHELRVPRPVDDVALVALLFSAGFLVDAGAEEEPSLRTWEFHDLLFHAASRQGRHDRASGATFRFAGTLPMPPALDPVDAGEAIDLPRPDLDRLVREDRPFAAVLEERHSIRAYRDAPISLAQLGELLFRSARVTARSVAEYPTAEQPIRIDIAHRPYPSAGGLYEIDLYAAVQSCEGLPPGLYRYDPAGHRLLIVGAEASHTAALLADAARGAALPPETLQVLLILAARVPRVAWKYNSMAYAAVLKNAGVLLQTLYLAATAMGLAPCAIGSGDSDRFARATGRSLLEQTAVAEFLLGLPATR